MANNNGKKIGSVSTGNRAGTLRDALKSARTPVSYANVPDTDILRLVRQTCDNGFGLVLSVTSDGGAFAVTILDGGSAGIKQYPSSYEEFGDFVGRVCDNLKS